MLINAKNFIKLGDKSFNINKIDYLIQNEEDLSIIIFINSSELKFKFKNFEEYNRFTSYVKLFSTVFDCEIVLVSNEDHESDKKILND